MKPFCLHKWETIQETESCHDRIRYEQCVRCMKTRTLVSRYDGLSPWWEVRQK